MWKWCSATGFVAVLFASSVAHAEMATLAGAWSFRAVHAAADCTITGDAVVRDTSTRDVYEVSLVATETCGGLSNTPVEQSCRATRSGDSVLVDCVVLYPDRAPGYLPDDFELVVQAPNVMVGRLTANWNQPAVWRRGVSDAPVA
ncbi:MAG TPA: hypothetical protein VEA80_07435 [Vitreimonas sp.]|uniref:hypothetical protein n=1 Tax=Vitreimonas sp. TaxID=3069702 RepID=UPI002D5EE9A1|nr:hypothetical protein [Vitreimonas sp.]HYD87290.1 hypothetical protein [Vitreimonas sp.]